LSARLTEEQRSSGKSLIFKNGTEIAGKRSQKIKGERTMMATRVVRALMLAASLAIGAPAVAGPTSVEIFAKENSSSGGVGADTGLNLVAGDRLVSTVDPLDCWSAGAANRISNANGLDGASPAPCQPTGDFGLHSQDGETFRYGALVGRIDAGDWFLLGTSFDGIVGSTGRLFLAYWDSNSGDNFGSVTALISVNPSEVPEPGTLGLIGLALLGVASLRRRSE
jgi:hypothetical protein